MVRIPERKNSGGSVIECIVLTDQRFKLVFKDASFRTNIFPFNDKMRLKIERKDPFVEKICFLIFNCYQAGSRWQEAGGRRQEAGGGRQEAGGRRQEAGGGRQEAGSPKLLALGFRHIKYRVISILRG
jgi:hypothetical protein